MGMVKQELRQRLLLPVHGMLSVSDRLKDAGHGITRLCYFFVNYFLYLS
ncbi:hypothetical protein KNP414_01095 [Paenibacillus mucilaginosus KNP414]|uniref:Uncharacterized protein n=1 Tax=Paenibacillus mucilaginosus (strain KNP414) TaxID=1036673 RepID=F8FCU1_PAEMK|nr:hypothetical protein KNP414_01095 [Paenibacillus mucilaginosus KNP414]